MLIFVFSFFLLSVWPAKSYATEYTEKSITNLGKAAKYLYEHPTVTKQNIELAIKTYTLYLHQKRLIFNENPPETAEEKFHRDNEFKAAKKIQKDLFVLETVLYMMNLKDDQ